MQPQRNADMAVLVSALVIFCVAGCASPYPRQPLSQPDFRPFSVSGEEQTPDRWWTAFGSGDLNQRIERALENNPDMETAWQRLKEAEAVVRREAGALFPNAEAFGEAEASKSHSEDDRQLRLGFASSYEVDLWGKFRARADAEKFRAGAALSAYRTAAVTVSAEVSLAWFQLMEARRQVELIQEQLETNRKVLQLIRHRFEIGETRSVDVLRQRQLVEFSNEQKITAESAIGVLEHRLAVLEGRQPQEDFMVEPGGLPALPPLPETGLPAALIRRRPDVRQAFQRLKAADRDLAAAVSDRYPGLRLTGSLSTIGGSPGDLFVNWAYAILGNLTATLFDAGQQWAEVDRAEAFKRQRFAQYRQTILVAFREVEDALVQEIKQKQRIRSIETQVQLARRAYDRLRTEYLNGIGGYIDVLVALTEEQRLRRSLLSEKRRLLEFRIGLYRALAGGFETERENQG